MEPLQYFLLHLQANGYRTIIFHPICDGTHKVMVSKNESVNEHSFNDYDKTVNGRGDTIESAVINCMNVLIRAGKLVPAARIKDGSDEVY